MTTAIFFETEKLVKRRLQHEISACGLIICKSRSSKNNNEWPHFELKIVIWIVILKIYLEVSSSFGICLWRDYSGVRWAGCGFGTIQSRPQQKLYAWVALEKNPLNEKRPGAGDQSCILNFPKSISSNLLLIQTRFFPLDLIKYGTPTGHFHRCSFLNRS